MTVEGGASGLDSEMVMAAEHVVPFVVCGVVVVVVIIIKLVWTWA